MLSATARKPQFHAPPLFAMGTRGYATGTGGFAMGTGEVRSFLRYAIAGGTVLRAVKVALVVGPVLTLINHAHTLIALEFTARFYLQTLLTFCVPYLVSTYSSAMTELATHRQQSRARAQPGEELPLIGDAVE